MEESAPQPTVTYTDGTAKFQWELPESGDYDQQQIGRQLKPDHISTFMLKFTHCHGHPYVECYDVNHTDTTAEIDMTQEDFHSSNFDHLLLQRDDVVLTTPFGIAGGWVLLHSYSRFRTLFLISSSLFRARG